VPARKFEQQGRTAIKPLIQVAKSTIHTNGKCPRIFQQLPSLHGETQSLHQQLRRNLLPWKQRSSAKQECTAQQENEIGNGNRRI